MTTTNTENIRLAFAKFATGVCVVTSHHREAPIGMTVSSFNSVSLDPALVLWSVGKHAPEYEAFCSAPHYAIHILSNEQAGLSNRFATPGIDKFEGMDIEYSKQGVPLLSGCLARFQCDAQHNYPAGDHNILVGAISAIDLVDVTTDQSPLLYFASSYCEIGSGLAG